jgi:hypothetical protein
MMSTQAFGDRYVTHRARIGNDMSARLKTKSWMLARLSFTDRRLARKSSSMSAFGLIAPIERSWPNRTEQKLATEE